MSRLKPESTFKTPETVDSSIKITGLELLNVAKLLSVLNPSTVYTLKQEH